MRLMREKQIFAVPTFTIFEYFAEHGETPAQAARERGMLDFKTQEFRKQIAAGRFRWPWDRTLGRFTWDAGAGVGSDGEVWDAAAGSDTGGPAEWSEIARLGGTDWGAGGGLSGDVIAVSGDPLQDIGVLGNVSFCDEGWGSLQEVNRLRTAALKANCECRVYDMPEGISRYESSLNPIYLDPIYLDPIYPDPAYQSAVSRIFGIVFRPVPV